MEMRMSFAPHQLGQLLALKGDTAGALQYTKLGVQAGDPDAMFALGMRHCASSNNNWGLEHSFKTAAEYFAKAAAKGSPEAVKALAKCYACGLGVPMDKEKAAYWENEAGGRDAVFNDTPIPGGVRYMLSGSGEVDSRDAQQSLLPVADALIKAGLDVTGQSYTVMPGGDSTHSVVVFSGLGDRQFNLGSSAAPAAA
jgi:hypothetical protein